ncbi:Bro-h [Artaxa digramma nucleopolyhedrovirus]|uniref:Bro-h n=1 Tax=Artaxa digramma nucleopolyhedrovirus TaxID=3070910 RepID=A0AAE6V0J7_9ABAC|nr:Bro-h [Euproctis digramma nucleopolyhedrovirus]QHB21804.1 Bro-h [Artaxa digramma nucleopolyhedrovirus]
MPIIIYNYMYTLYCFKIKYCTIILFYYIISKYWTFNSVPTSVLRLILSKRDVFYDFEYLNMSLTKIEFADKIVEVFKISKSGDDWMTANPFAKL